MTAHGARPGRADAPHRPQTAGRCAHDHDRAGVPGASAATAGTAAEPAPAAGGRPDRSTARSTAVGTRDRARSASSRAWLARADPAGKLLAAVVVAVGLIPVVDPVTSGIVLAAGLALVPFSGLDRVRLLAVGGPLLLMCVSVGLVNLLFGTEGPIGALGAAVRLPAIALPSLLAAVTSDPTDMSDSLVQRLRVPERPAVAVLAALRLVPLLVQQWRTLGRARRARGLEAGGNPVRAVAVFAGKVFALLVRAVRTGTLLAMAMDARGFAGGRRTHARLSRWRTPDTVLIAGTVAVLAAAHAASAAAGTWTPLTL